MTKETRLIVRTHSGEGTVDVGRKLGALLHGGDVIALSGELGSGKTWFTKGMALGLGVSPRMVVTSPSFALMNEYEGEIPLFHMDVYRLDKVSDFLDAGLEEYLYGEGVVAMEWSDRWPQILPDRCVRVHLTVLDETSREIALSGQHKRAVAILEQMKQELER
ncbi:MAG: tRNA (adenosine(37)-N6)-threonylcarbamoyltransferase complex ATPase subunit type 1 TsaE [Desulfobacteraceae bacterium]